MAQRLTVTATIVGSIPNRGNKLFAFTHSVEEKAQRRISQKFGEKCGRESFIEGSFCLPHYKQHTTYTGNQ